MDTNSFGHSLLETGADSFVWNLSLSISFSPKHFICVACLGGLSFNPPPDLWRHGPRHCGVSDLFSEETKDAKTRRTTWRERTKRSDVIGSSLPLHWGVSVYGNKTIKELGNAPLGVYHYTFELFRVRNVKGTFVDLQVRQIELLRTGLST